MLGILCGHPLDTLKVRQQVLGVRSPLHCLTATLRHEGASGLLNGLAFPLLSAGVVNSLTFGCFQSSLRRLEGGRDDPPSLAAVALAGAAAGLLQLSVAVPVDVVKIQLQTRTAPDAVWSGRQLQQSTSRGAVACFLQLFRSRGLAGCYQAAGVQLLRDVPATSCYFVVYEWLMRTNRRAARPLSEPVAVLLAGGTAGVVSWALILPLDGVKSRLQADDPARRRYRGLRHCLQHTLSTAPAGPRVLLAGFTMVSVRAFIVNAATFLGYEYGMQLMTGSQSLQQASSNGKVQAAGMTDQTGLVDRKLV